MDNSALFSYVPLIGIGNLMNAVDNDGGGTKPFLISVGDEGAWVPQNAVGDYGNQPTLDTVDSFTSETPEGRAGKMITSFEVIGEGTSAIGEVGTLLALVAVPPGESGLLQGAYTLSRQPPEESFNLAAFLPRTDAKGQPSLFGTADSYAFFPGLPTGRFPTGPRTRPYDSASAYVLAYLPVSFYPNINTVVNDLLGFEMIDVTLQVNSAPHGAMLVAVHFAVLNDDYPLRGAGVVKVDFSHSTPN
jgi:hypothetical protein